VKATLSRRQVLAAGLAGAATLFAGCGSSTSSVSVTETRSRPRPDLRAGTDLQPKIKHIVIVMMENHSFDNVLGILGRGDGFTLGTDGLPTSTNPDGKRGAIRAFHMPTPCQTTGVSNDWRATHLAYDNGTCQGFVTSSTAEAMGYLTSSDLPYTNGLAASFPIADRYFCSVMAQTYPNRRYLLAGTSLGLVDDSFPSTLPPNGVIFDQLNRLGITWHDYYSTLPSLGVFLPLLGRKEYSMGLVPISQFFADAAAGQLPAVSLVEPDYGKQSEEDPQDVQFGDQFLGQVATAVMSSPNWPDTMLIWTYDEHGGYYDHVPPPAAVPPDAVPPALKPTDPPGKFDRYGFRGESLRQAELRFPHDL
jgi:phospholipase C